MRPIKLQISNLGLLSGEYPLSPVTLITGDNRTGKTTILKALEFVNTGNVYDPEQGRNATFDELTAPGVDEMAVHELFDTGFWIKRKLTRIRDENGKVTIKQYLDFLGMPQSSMGRPRQAESELVHYLTTSKYGFNIRAIIEAKTTERRKLLLGMLVGSPDKRPLQDWIFAEAVEKSDLTDDDQKELEKLIGIYAGTVSKDMQILDALQRVNSSADETLKAAKNRLESTTSVIKNLGFGQGESVDTSELPKLESDLKVIEKDIKTVSQQLGSTKSDITRRDSLTGQIADIQKKESAIGVTEGQDALVDKKELLKRQKSEAVAGVTLKYDERRDKATDFCNTETSRLNGEIAGIRSKIAVIDADLKRYDNEEAAFTKKNQALSVKMQQFGNHAESNCPFCGSVIEPAELMRLWDNERGDNSIEIQKLTGKRNDIKKTKEAYNASIADFEKQKAKLETAKNETLADIKKQEKPELDKINNDFDDQVSKIEGQIESLRERARLSKSRIEKETELAGIQIVETEDLVSQLHSLENKKLESDSKLSKLIIAESDARKKSELESQQFQEMRSVRCLDAIKKATSTQGIPGILLQEKITPFIKMVNDVLIRFAPDMLFNIEFQDDRGKESCQFGFHANGIWTLFESASGVEKRLILFAIVIALMNQEKFVNQRILVLDEISVADEHMAPVLLEAAQIAINEKLIDAAYLAGALRGSDLEVIMEHQPDIFDSMIVCTKEVSTVA